MNTIKMTFVSVREVLEQQLNDRFEGWLYLPEPPWTLATNGIFILEDINADPCEEFPRTLLAPCRLVPVMEAAEIEDVIEYAKREKSSALTEDLLISFTYYFEHDAFFTQT